MKRTRLVSLRRFGLAWVRNYIPMLTHLFCSSHLMPLSTTRCCCWEQCSWSTLCFLRIIIAIVVVNRTVSCVFVNNSKIGGFSVRDDLLLFELHGCIINFANLVRNRINREKCRSYRGLNPDRRIQSPE